MGFVGVCWDIVEVWLIFCRDRSVDAGEARS